VVEVDLCVEGEAEREEHQEEEVVLHPEVAVAVEDFQEVEAAVVDSRPEAEEVLEVVSLEDGVRKGFRLSYVSGCVDISAFQVLRVRYCLVAKGCY
jgi:hypothetical protein